MANPRFLLGGIVAGLFGFIALVSSVRPAHAAEVAASFHLPLDGAVRSGGATIHNLPGGLFLVQCDNALLWYSAGPSAFLNGGTFRKTAGTGVTTVGSSVTFTNTGTVEVQSGTLRCYYGFYQSAGETRFAGGSLDGGTFNFSGGTLSGSGIINGSIVNAAELSPGGSPGTISINGSYTQTSAGILKIEIGGLAPGSQYDQLVVNGPVTLAGSLNVTLLNGFMPSLGDNFSVLSYGSRDGNFASIVQPGLSTGLALTPTYGPSALALQVANLIGGVETNTFSLAPGPGALELRFPSGPLGLYRFQASSNLVDWVDLSTNTPPGEVFRFVDLGDSGLDHRFYRAVSP